MTPEELHAAIQSGDTARVVDLLLTATEPERRAAVGTVHTWRRALRAELRGRQIPEQTGFQCPLNAWDLENLLSFCLHATGTLNEIKESGWWPRSPFDEPTITVLRQRRPDWLARWAEWVLEDAIHWWPEVRSFVREGLCARPESDAYILGMIRFLWPPGHDRRQLLPPLREILLTDPDLLKHEVWRLFEVEGGGENSLAAHDKYSHDRWSDALIALAAEGHLSRDRLLDASLDALASDFAPFRAGWFSRFHAALEPTLAERQTRCDRYLLLLSSAVPTTVAFALKSLALLDRAEALPGEALLDHVAPALYARAVGTVKQALALIDRAARRSPSLRDRAAAVGTEALAYESPEAQAAAIAIIERYGNREDSKLRERLLERAAVVAASQRCRLDDWLGGCAASEPAQAINEEAAIIALLERAEALPPELAARAGVTAAVRALQGRAWEIPALDWEVTRVPRLEAAARLSPIDTLEELIEVFAAVLENEGPPDEIERVLDGVSRLCVERPANFDRHVGSLRKRARALLSSTGEEGGQFFGEGEAVFAGRLPRRDLCGVALAWLDGEWHGTEPVRCSLGGFLSSRAAAVAKRAMVGQATPLLAAPTHSGGWIDPPVLVARLLEQQGASRDALDLIQALLRLAPDRRSEALAAARELEGEIGEAVRYAFGGEGISIGPTAPLWVAAARARNPEADDLALEARHPKLGPHAGRVPRAELECERSESAGYSFRRPIWKYLEVPRHVMLEYPTVLHHAVIEGETAALRRWAATIWPAGREAWFATGARLISDNLDWWEACWGDAVYLEPLLDPDVPLGPMARQFLALGLAAKEPGQYGLATDGLIAAIQDGRLDGARLATAMAPLIQIDLIKPSRWAKTLGDAARISALHAAVVCAGIEGALGGPPPARTADLVPLLQLLHELCLQAGAAIHRRDARDFLGSLPGSGKAARLAKALLALEETPQPCFHRAAARVALEGRLERAGRRQQRQ